MAFGVNRARLNYWADVVALASGVLVFATGLVLMTELHMGEGALRGSAFGVSRLVWVNVHRLVAIVVLAGVGIHTFLHWKTIVTRVSRACTGLPGRAGRADLVLYFGFAIVLLAGFAAWLVFPESPALFGPIRLEHLAPLRHLCIDVHNLSGLILLPAAVIHVRRHFGWVLRATLKP